MFVVRFEPRTLKVLALQSNGSRLVTAKTTVTYCMLRFLPDVASSVPELTKLQLFYSCIEPLHRRILEMY